MADVRSLLRKEQNARKITHPHATYSTTGTLVCLVCHIQLKSESLWNGHLRSAQHAMRLQRIRDGTLGRPPGAPAPDSREQDYGESDRATTLDARTDNSLEISSKKRKADDSEDYIRKRSKASDLPEDFFDKGIADSITLTNDTTPSAGQELQLPSRPATPSKPPSQDLRPSKVAEVNEDEWAAFEADIAAADAPVAEDAVISAPAMSAADLAAKSREEESAQRKEIHEAELEGEKEDAARKLQDEFDEMEELEARLRRLKQKREAIRVKEAEIKSTIDAGTSDSTTAQAIATAVQEEDDDSDDEDDDDWDGFRLR
ncbi:MAG: hypothetical protein M1818_001417 [Claussenomyces sp. TS43310]|nr:MAG: hypothetical protein M1818_001417 [Claussenomyces sp. TS43310]